MAVLTESTGTTTGAQLQNDWPLDDANVNPSGLTIDPTGNSNSVWVVDIGSDSVYEYDRDSGDYLGSFPLDTAAGNIGPTGIADPPPPGTELEEDSAPVPPANDARGASLSRGASLVLIAAWPGKTHWDLLDRATTPRNEAWDAVISHDDTRLLPMATPDDTDCLLSARETYNPLTYREFSIQLTKPLDEELLDLISEHRAGDRGAVDGSLTKLAGAVMYRTFRI